MIVGGQVPFVPWATIYGRHYVWEKQRAASDTTGNEFYAELALHPNLTLALGTDDDNRSTREHYARLRVQLASLGRPTLTTGPVVAPKVFWRTDLSGETLDYVERENRIVVERTSKAGNATIIVRRGD